MPKGVVKCGNCEQWDLFRDGDPTLAYSISQPSSEKVATDNMKEGFYYTLNSNASGSRVACLLLEQVCTWMVWSTGIVIYQYTSNGLINRAGDAISTSPLPSMWMITIDEDSGAPQQQS